MIALSGIVEEARAAPSVHNAQPARWRLVAPDTIEILADRSRILSVSDPLGEDAALGCGAALEATIEALARQGLEADAVEDCWRADAGLPGLRTAARLRVRQASEARAERAGTGGERRTWRGGFAPLPAERRAAILDKLSGREGVEIVSDRRVIDRLATLGDEASRRIMRDRPFREELLDWMRLRPSHPRARLDGMDLQALSMSHVEAIGAGIALRYPAWEILRTLRLDGLLSSSGDATRGSSFLAIVHVPADASPLLAGRLLQRFWSSAAAEGLAGWPFSALCDDREAVAECARLVGIAPDKRIRAVLRLGPIPEGKRPAFQARLPVDALIVPS